MPSTKLNCRKVEIVYMPAYFLMFLEHDGLPENAVYEIEL